VLWRTGLNLSAVLCVPALACYAFAQDDFVDEARKLYCEIDGKEFYVYVRISPSNKRTRIDATRLIKAGDPIGPCDVGKGAQDSEILLKKNSLTCYH
jgi:hypothetical protein